MPIFLVVVIAALVLGSMKPKEEPKPKVEGVKPPPDSNGGAIPKEVGDILKVAGPAVAGALGLGGAGAAGAVGAGAGSATAVGTGAGGSALASAKAGAGGAVVAGGGGASVVGTVAVVAGAVAWVAIAVLSVIVSVFVIGTELARLAKGRRGALEQLKTFAFETAAKMKTALIDAGVPVDKAELVSRLYAFNMAAAFNEAGFQLVLRKPKSPFLSAAQHIEFWADRAFFVVREFVYTPKPGDSLGNSGPDPFAGMSPDQAAFAAITNPGCVAYQFQKTQALEASLFAPWGGYARDAYNLAGEWWTPALQAAAYAQGQLSWVVNGWLNGYTAFQAGVVGGEFSDTPVGWGPAAAGKYYSDLRIVDGVVTETHLTNTAAKLALNFPASDAEKGPVIESTVVTKAAATETRQFSRGDL